MIIVDFKSLQLAIILPLVDAKHCARGSVDIAWLDLSNINTYELGIIIYNLQLRKWKLGKIK